MSKPKIIPSIMGKNQKEINALFKKLKGTSKRFHLDIADRKCVPNTSLWFDLKLPRTCAYAAHLMIRKPLEWMKRYEKKIDLFIPQFEEIGDWQEYLDWTKAHKKKRAISIRPKVNIKKVMAHIKDLDYLLVLTVQPGFYGAPFAPQALKNIKMFKKANPKLKIIVDGHMNQKTAPWAIKAGADILVCGSYLAAAENPKKMLRELKGELKK